MKLWNNHVQKSVHAISKTLPLFTIPSNLLSCVCQSKHTSWQNGCMSEAPGTSTGADERRQQRQGLLALAQTPPAFDSNRWARPAASSTLLTSGKPARYQSKLDELNFLPKEIVQHRKSSSDLVSQTTNKIIKLYIEGMKHKAQ